MTRTRKKVKLEKCSKPELIWVIRRMCQYALSERELRLALNDLEYKRESDRIDAVRGKQLKISHPKRWSRLMQRFPERVLLIGRGVN